VTAAEFCKSGSECGIRATQKLLSYGPAFRPNPVGQPTNFRAEKKWGLTLWGVGRNY